MSQTSVSFPSALIHPPASIAEDEVVDGALSCTANESLLEQLDLELAMKTGQMRQLVDRLAASLDCEIKLQICKLPKSVQNMTMREFLNQYGGDVEEAMLHAHNSKHMMPPPPLPTAVSAAGGRAPRGGAKAAPTPTSSKVAAVPSSAGRKRGVADTPTAASETPGGRGVRSKRLQMAATPSAGGAAKGLVTPAGGRGAGAMPVGAITPRQNETPRALQPGETGFSATGSPIAAAPDTVKARAGIRSNGAPAPSVLLTMADGSELDLGEAAALTDLEEDNEKKVRRGPQACPGRRSRVRSSVHLLDCTPCRYANPTQRNSSLPPFRPSSFITPMHLRRML